MTLDPIELYKTWFAEAASRVSETHQDPKAAFLSTADADGRPSGRVVLIQYADERGFVFYTNLGSPKARNLTEQPRPLCMFWPSWSGNPHRRHHHARPSNEEADAYFASRPRESQIGAWASRQSVPRRATCSRPACTQMEARFAGQPARPEFWSATGSHRNASNSDGRPAACTIVEVYERTTTLDHVAAVSIGRIGHMPRRVLVVDNEALVRWSLVERLRQSGCETWKPAPRPRRSSWRTRARSGPARLPAARQ